MAILNKEAKAPKAPSKVMIEGVEKKDYKKANKLVKGKKYIVSKDVAETLIDKGLAKKVKEVEAVKAEGEK